MGFGTPPGVNPWDDYFYCLFPFNSLDGVGQTISGSAMITLFGGYLRLKTGATINSVASLDKWIAYLENFVLRWSKKRKTRTAIWLSSVADVTIFLCSGEDIISTPTNDHIGFKIINNSLYGTVADGTTEATLLLQTINADTPYLLECILNPSISECRFFVDGVDKEAITTNLPTTEWTSSNVMHIGIKNTAAADKSLWLSSWEFWQDR